MTRNYPTDVSDEEWDLLKPELCAAGQQRRRGRVASEASVRACFNALRYVLKTGCHWRMLPKEYPPRSTVHDALSRWTKSGLHERLNRKQTAQRREQVKKRAAQRGGHRQPERQMRRHGGRRQQRLRRRQKDQRPHATHPYRHAGASVGSHRDSRQRA